MAVDFLALPSRLCTLCQPCFFFDALCLLCQASSSSGVQRKDEVPTSPNNTRAALRHEDYQATPSVQASLGDEAYRALCRLRRDEEPDGEVPIRTD